eukprot:1307982-Rhodomonas_salina.1
MAFALFSCSCLSFHSDSTSCFFFSSASSAALRAGMSHLKQLSSAMGPGCLPQQMEQGLYDGLVSPLLLPRLFGMKPP